MLKFRPIVPVILLAAGCTHQVGPSSAISSAQAQLDETVEAYFDRFLELNPLSATYVGDPRYNHRLANDISPEYRAAMLALDRRYLQAVQAIDPASLDESARISRAIFIREREAGIEGAQFPEHLLPVDQWDALPISFAVLGAGAGAQPFGTVKDYDDFLLRIEDFILWSDQAIRNMRVGAAQGIVQPRVLMLKLLPQLQALIAEDPTKSLFYQPVLALPDSFPSRDRDRLAAAYRLAIDERLMPAYRRLHDFVLNEYLPATRDTVGRSALPNGSAWYRYRVRQFTTTDLSPGEIHELGLQEVARIRAEMEQVRVQVGFSGDLPAFFEHLKTHPSFYFSSGTQLVQGYQELKSRIDARLPELFADFPRADYQVREVESFRAASSAGAFYQPPSPDGSRPGIFYINTYNLAAQPIFGMETLSLHEAAPGHHFQVSVQQELSGLPRFRRLGGGLALFRRFEGAYVAYTEGWALYSETLGRQLGLFTDPYQYYGHLNDGMLRAMRLVVDTGLHDKGWTREQAMAYMLDNSSMAPSDVEAEVERYIADPGQALGYKIGQIRILELRARAERALGERFDLKAFHSQVLRDGALPLAVLEAKLDRWLAAQRSWQGGPFGAPARHN